MNHFEYHSPTDYERPGTADDFIDPAYHSSIIEEFDRPPSFRERLRPRRILKKLALAAKNLLDTEPHHHHHAHSAENDTGETPAHDHEHSTPLLSRLGHRAVVASQFLATAVETTATGVAFAAGGLAATFGAAIANIGHGIADVGAHIGHDRLDRGEMLLPSQRRLRRLTFGAVRASGYIAVAEGLSTLTPRAATLAKNAGHTFQNQALERGGELALQGMNALSRYPLSPFHGLQEKVASPLQVGGSIGQIGAAYLTSAIVTAAIVKKHGSIEAMQAKSEAEAGHEQDRYEHTVSDKRISVIGGSSIIASLLLPDALSALETPLQIAGAAGLLYVGGKVIRDFKYHIREHEKDTKGEKEITPEKRRFFSKAVLAAGATAVAACTVLTGNLAGNETSTAVVVPPSAQPDISFSEPDSPGCVTVKTGDSQWSIGQQYAGGVLGSPANDQLTYRVMQTIGGMNASTHPDPQIIYPGDCLSVPSTSMLLSLQKASS